MFCRKWLVGCRSPRTQSLASGKHPCSILSQSAASLLTVTSKHTVLRGHDGPCPGGEPRRRGHEVAKGPESQHQLPCRIPGALPGSQPSQKLSAQDAVVVMAEVAPDASPATPQENHAQESSWLEAPVAYPQASGLHHRPQIALCAPWWMVLSVQQSLPVVRPTPPPGVPPVPVGHGGLPCHTKARHHAAPHVGPSWRARCPSFPMRPPIPIQAALDQNPCWPSVQSKLQAQST